MNILAKSKLALLFLNMLNVLGHRRGAHESDSSNHHGKSHDNHHGSGNDSHHSKHDDHHSSEHDDRHSFGINIVKDS